MIARSIYYGQSRGLTIKEYFEQLETYDYETEHSRNFEKQAEWDQQIAIDLKDLQDYEQREVSIDLNQK